MSTKAWAIQYSEALEKSNRIELGTIHIKIVTPVYFLATKLEAFKGRGNDDVLGSQDVEDILTLFNGRPEIVQEVADANNELSTYIQEGVASLLHHHDIDYAVQSASSGDTAVAKLIFERLEITAGTQ